MIEYYTMDTNEVMTEFTRYEAEAAAGLLIDRDEWLAQIDAMLVDMYEHDQYFIELPVEF